jgi:hypothetical protein
MGTGKRLDEENHRHSHKLCRGLLLRGCGGWLGFLACWCSTLSSSFFAQGCLLQLVLSQKASQQASEPLELAAAIGDGDLRHQQVTSST